MSDAPDSPSPIRVVLADDHELLRQGLKLLLQLHAEIQIVGEARTGREAVEVALSLKPDVVVMDISMPAYSSSTARCTGPYVNDARERRVFFTSIAYGCRRVSGEESCPF